MKKTLRIFRKILLFSLALVLSLSVSNAQLDVSDEYTATELIEDILLGGGVQISNVSVTWGNYVKSMGYFENGEDANLGIEEGMILTSGSIYNALPANQYSDVTEYFFGNGDVDLDSLIHRSDPYEQSYDVTAIEFDFTPLFTNISFNYVFASDEYEEFVCSQYNDVFGFFLSGPGINGGFSNNAINIARIPGTDIEVAINAVNNGCHNAPDSLDPTDYCSFWGPCSASYSQYFNSNPPASTYHEYDGYTDVFTASLTDLQPCQTYHIKLAIGDAGDYFYDSGVFIEKGSFESVGEYGGTEVTICSGVETIIGPDEVEGLDYTWTDPNGYLSATNVPNPGVTITNTGTSSATYSFPLEIEDCVSTTFTVIVLPEPETDITATSSTICRGETGTELYVEAVSGASYTWSLNQNGTIIDGTNSSTVTIDWDEMISGNSATVSLRAVGENGCEANENYVIYFYDDPDVSIMSDVACNNRTAEYVANSDSEVYTNSWSVSGGTIQGSATGDELTVLWGDGSEGSVTVVHTNSITGCSRTVTHNVNINPLPTAEILEAPESGNYIICAGGTETFYSDDSGDPPGNYVDEYEWEIEGDGMIISENGSSDIIISFPQSEGSATLTLTKTFETGCTNSTSMPIQINLTDPDILCGDDVDCFSVCEDETGVSYEVEEVEGGSYEWSVEGAVISSGQYTNSITLDFNGGTDAVLSVTVIDGDGCFGTDEETITINPLPEPEISGETDVCDSESGVVYSAADPDAESAYSWSVTNGTITNGQGTSAITVNFSGTGTSVVTLTETNSEGCTNSASTNVTKHAYPGPVVSGENEPCEFTAGHTYSTPDNSEEGNTYEWSVLGGEITSGQGTAEITVEWDVEGLGLVSVTETSEYGCAATDNYSIIIYPNPDPEITGNDETCEYTQNLVYSVEAGTGFTYTWEVFGGEIVDGQGTNEITVDAGADGDMDISITVTSDHGCVGYDDFEVTVYPDPVPEISGDNELCANGDEVQYSTPFRAGDTYEWSLTGGTIVSGQNSRMINVIWNTSGIQTLSVTETTIHGCTASDDYEVLVHPNPAPAISGNDEVCEEERGVVYSTMNNSGSSYRWSVTGGNIASGNGTNSITVNWNGDGIYTVSVTETSEFGCTGSDEIEVIVYPFPEPDILGNDVVCAFDRMVEYSTEDHSSDGNSYQWTVTGGTISSGQGTATIYVDWKDAGTGTVRVTETTGYNCYDSDEMDVRINTLPEAKISGEFEICANNYADYQTSSSRGIEILWEVQGGTVIGADNNEILRVLWGESGTGNVILTKTDPVTGCSNTNQRSIKIYPLPHPQISGENEVCGNNTENYNAEDLPGNSYNWVVRSGDIISGQGTSEITVEWASLGSGVVKLFQTNEYGCVDSIEKAVKINRIPSTIIDGARTVCANSIEIYETNSEEKTAISWIVSGGIILGPSNDEAVTVEWGGTGKGSIRLTKVNDNACLADKTIPVIINPVPTVQIDGPEEVCIGGITQFTTMIESGLGYTNKWSVSDGDIIGSDEGGYVEVVFDSEGQKTVRVVQTNRFGCSDTAVYTVNVTPGPEPLITGATEACIETSTGYNVSSGPDMQNEWEVTGAVIINEENDFLQVQFSETGTATIKVTQTDKSNGCIGTNEINVTVYPLPDVTLEVPDLCENDEPIALEGKPEGGIYSGTAVSNGQFDPRIAGVGEHEITYSYQDEHGCLNSTSTVVNVNPVPGQPNTNVNRDSITCDEGYSYQWYLDGEPIQGATDRTLIMTQAGEYSVVIINEFGCESEESVPFYYDPSSVSKSMTSNGISVYPNPAEGYIYIEFTRDYINQMEIKLSGLIGNEFYTEKVSSFSGKFFRKINLDDLTSGVYLLQISIGNELFHEKIIIRK